MKIGIDIRTLMDRHYSGVSEYVFNLVNNLLDIDLENEYFLFYNSAHDISGRIPNFSSPRVKVVYTRYPNKIFNYFLQKLFKQPKIDEILGGVDIFLSPHINFLALSDYCQKVLTVHDLSYLRHPEFFSRRKNFWHSSIDVKKMVKKFDKIVAVSENTKNDLMELAETQHEKVKVIYAGVPSDYRPLPINDSLVKAVKEKHDLPEKFILYLGNIEPRKNISGLIKAYNNLRRDNLELKDVKLIVAGATGWKIDDTFSELQASPYYNDIKFLGYIDREDKPALYNLATVFIYPSFYEGFGFPPLEAMACGLPVITSNISSLPEIVGNAALTVDPYNISALSQALKEVITNLPLHDELVEQGIIRASAFNWRQTAQNYLEIFKELHEKKS
jgi:glycosyltransferase involved in cell wall biosynthesis